MIYLIINGDDSMAKLKIELPRSIHSMSESELRDYIYGFAEAVTFVLSNIDEENCNKFFLKRLERKMKNGGE